MVERPTYLEVFLSKKAIIKEFSIFLQPWGWILEMNDEGMLK